VPDTPPPVEDPNQAYHRTRLYANLSTLVSHVLKDPVTASMIKHGKGLQRLCKAIAREGSKWLDQEVLPYSQIPMQGEHEVDTFYQYCSFDFPDPCAAFPEPDMETLHRQLQYQKYP